MIPEKVLIFAKELDAENFQTSDGWSRSWKERNHITRDVKVH